MNLRRMLLGLVLLLAITACNRPQKSDVSTPEKESQLSQFLDADIVETKLAAFLNDEFGLTNAWVTFEDEVLKIYLEQPGALADEQLMLVYLGSLDAAARFAPASKKVNLTIALGGDPLISIESETEQINAYRRGEIDLTAFVGQLMIVVPGDDGTLSVAPAIASDPLPSPTAPLEVDLSVGPVSIVYNEGQGWLVYALLNNDGSTLATGVSAQVEIYDDAGSIIASETARAMQSTIQPGHSSALLVELENDSVPAEARVAQPEAESIYPAELVKFSQVVDRYIVDAENERVVLVGELQNVGENPIIVDSAMGLLLNDQGEILAHEFDYYYAPQLLAGETTPISFDWYNIEPALLDQVSMVEIVPEVRLARKERQSSLSISTSTRVFFDHIGRPHLIGLLRNEGELPERPVLLGALLDSSSKILDCAAQWGEPPLVLPGMTVPFDLDTWPLLNIAPDMASEAANFDLRVDSYNSYAPQDYEIIPVENFHIDWSVKDGEVVVEGLAQVPSAQFDEFIAIMMLRDVASGEIIAAGHGFFHGEGTEATLSEYIPYDPAFDPNEAELSVEVYTVKLIG